MRAAPEVGLKKSGFFRGTLIWMAGLVVLALAYQLLTRVGRGGEVPAGEVIFLLISDSALLLPAAAFAGGLAAFRTLTWKGASARGILLALLAYGLGAWATPVLEYETQEWGTEAMSAQYPFGPFTPGGILATREAVRMDPPGTYSFSTDRPLETPGNWWTYLLHSVAVLSAFAVFAALLGHRVGILTRDLSPPIRFNVRWFGGLATAVGFYLGLMIGDDWVRSDPGHSGALGAWIALAVPLVELGVLLALSRRSSAGARTPPPPGI